MLLGDVADKFLDNDGFADTGAAEQTDFTAFQKRTNKVNNFDAGF